MSAAARFTRPDGSTIWEWHCDRCGQTSLCCFPDGAAAVTAMRDHETDRCRAVAA